MKLKKRKKTSRQRGSTTHGWGFRQKHKGPGNSGGHGMSGTGKKASQKQQKALMIARAAGAKKYFGKRGFTSRKTAKKKNKVINLQEIKERFHGDKIILKDYKILGKGEGFSVVIEAGSASKSAIEKMEKEGGKIIILEKKERVEKKDVEGEKRKELKEEKSTNKKEEK